MAEQGALAGAESGRGPGTERLADLANTRTGAAPAGQAQVASPIWILDAFTPDNGPTRVLPGAHRAGHLRLTVGRGAFNRRSRPRRPIRGFWTSSNFRQ